MGMAVCYRSMRPVTPAEASAISETVDELCRGRTWLSCEPVNLRDVKGDRHLGGSSKPNFAPHPDDVAAAAREALPDGTASDMLDILCQLSLKYGLDWEISHDYSDGPLGYIKNGACDEEMKSQIEALGDLCDIFGELDAPE